MVYDHIVKSNGEYYPAGTDVPEQVKETSTLPFSDSDITLETEPVKKGRPRKTSQGDKTWKNCFEN